jgi:glycosyltransferase involved in cell wall biosynthesis
MDLAPLHALVRDHGLAERVLIEPRFVADAEVGELLSSADIIALPYRDIDASGVLMTAISAGVPLVATRVGLFAELLEDGRHGRLIGVDDHLALARALDELVLSPELRARISDQVRELRDQIPSWESIARLTHNLYAELAPSGQTASEPRELSEQPRT